MAPSARPRRRNGHGSGDRASLTSVVHENKCIYVLRRSICAHFADFLRRIKALLELSALATCAA
jgi:hypothetical protein